MKKPEYTSEELEALLATIRDPWYQEVVKKCIGDEMLEGTLYSIVTHYADLMYKTPYERLPLLINVHRDSSIGYDIIKWRLAIGK